MTDVSECLVRTASAALRCRMEGKEGAPWVVFSNSLMTDLTLWDEQVMPLTDRFRVLRYDQRGHGGSPVPPTACTLDELASDLIAMLDAFEIASAALIGVSMGATTVIRAAQLDARIVRLMPCDGRAIGSPTAVKAWDERIALARDKGMEPLVEPTMTRWFPPNTLGGVGRLDRVRAMIRTTPVEGFVACARMLQSYDCTAGLASMKLPVLLLAGEADGDTPQAMRALQEHLRNSEFVTVPNAGHLPNIAAPEAFNAAMARFLSDYA